VVPVSENVEGDTVLSVRDNRDKQIQLLRVALEELLKKYTILRGFGAWDIEEETEVVQARYALAMTSKGDFK
jgi:hypothetical protein